MSVEKQQEDRKQWIKDLENKIYILENTHGPYPNSTISIKEVNKMKDNILRKWKKKLSQIKENYEFVKVFSKLAKEVSDKMKMDGLTEQASKIERAWFEPLTEDESVSIPKKVDNKK